MAAQQQLAFIFPGQGSQKVGMLSELAARSKTVEQVFAEASDVLGYDLWALTQEGPQDALNMTETTQPALLTASVAVWRVWHELNGAQPAFMAGHSLGEWSALVCSGVISFADAVRLVRARGRYMQEAVPAGQGAMAAIIGLEDAAVEEACRNAADDGFVGPVNYNSPGQVVIAGAAAAVGQAIEHCKASGAKRALPLPVSAPFHTPLMKPAADRLAEDIRDTSFREPSCKVIHNVNAASETSPDAIKTLMIEQIYSPVLWVSCVNKLAELGVNRTVECGPGKVLSGLVKRIDSSIATLATETTASLDEAIAQA